MIKRLLDLSLSLILLVVLWPVILVSIYLVRRSSHGPAIFRQERVGRDEKPFTCYKLRSMYVDTADLPSHQAPSSAITPIGKMLRRTKLDELPQLLNVLKGEMSFVGPRPCLPSQTELVDARRRLGVYALRPGITGLAQVKGIDMSNPPLLADIDADYLARQSLWLDLQLMMETILGAGQGDRVRAEK